MCSPRFLFAANNGQTNFVRSGHVSNELTRVCADHMLASHSATKLTFYQMANVLRSVFIRLTIGNITEEKLQWVNW